MNKLRADIERLKSELNSLMENNSLIYKRIEQA